MKKENADHTLRIYLSVTFGLGILLSALVGFNGGHTGKFNILGITAMFFPAVAVLILRLFKIPFPEAGGRNFRFSWVLLALFIFPVVIHLFCLPVIALQNDFALPWQSWLSPEANGLYHAPVERHWGQLTKIGLVKHIIQNAIVGVIVVSALAFFEEIGWRAWLLPRLMERFSLKVAILFSAVIWALWHIPFVLGGIHYIENAPMWVLCLFNPLGHVGAGIILGWLWIRTRSIWIVCIAHGSLNNWGQYAFKFMDNGSAPADAIGLVIALNLSLLIAGLIVLASMQPHEVTRVDNAIPTVT